MTDTDITMLLTGPTRGLGQATVAALAQRGVRHLVLLGRPGPRLDSVAQAARAGGVRTAATVAVDLADLASVAAAGRQVAALAPSLAAPLRVAVLNAGVQHQTRALRSAQGHERTFAVNVLAQHLLLRSVLPVLGEGGHAILLGSGTHYGDRSLGLVPPPRWADPQELARPDTSAEGASRRAGATAYATSKLAVVMLAQQWQARTPERRVTVYDPGLMPGTGLIRDGSRLVTVLWRGVLPLLSLTPAATTPARSAAHLADLALGRAHPQLRGGYVDQGRVRPAADAAYDIARQDRLWQVCEQLTTVGAEAADS